MGEKIIGGIMIEKVRAIKELTINGIIVHKKVIERMASWSYDEGAFKFYDKDKILILVASGGVNILFEEEK